MKEFRRRGLALLLALFMVMACVPVHLFAATPQDVVLYEAYGGGGNSGAELKNDYIVLKNISDKPVDLTGRKVGYFSAKKNVGAAPASTAELSGTLPAGGYYVIKGAVGDGGNKELPRFDMEANIALSGKNFALVLYDAEGKVSDTLGVGTAKIFSGAAAPALSNTTAAVRTGYTGDNSKDWVTAPATADHLAYLQDGSEPTPTEPAEPTEPAVPSEDVVPIAEAKAAADKTPVVVEGVVTYSGKDGNTFIQDDTAGINVYKVSSVLEPGTKVRVTGTRGVYADQIQISQTKIEKLGKTELPAPINISLADLKKDEYNGKRVAIKGATVKEMNQFGDPILEQDGATAQVYKAPKGNYEVTDTVDVIGVAGVHKGNPQLRVQSAGDIVVMTKGEGPKPVDPLPEVEDPLTDEMIANVKKNYPDLLTIPEAQKIHAGFTADPNGKGPQTVKENATVIGVATYVYSDGSSLIIEDVVDGKVYGYQIFGPTENVEMGDIVVAKGNLVSFYGLPEMSNVETMKKVGSAKPVDPLKLTIEQIKKHGEDLVNVYVEVKDVTLPAYSGENTIDMKDPTGILPSYRTPAYPIGTVEGDKVGIRGAIAPHRGNPQIRMNDARDYILGEDKLAPFIVTGRLIQARAGIDYTFSIDVIDNVEAVEVEASYDGKTIKLEQNPATGKWIGTIPGQDLAGKSELELSFTAKDKAGNTSSKLYEAPFEYGVSESIGDSVVLSIDNSPQIVNPKPANNEATKENKRPEISADVLNVSDNAKATLSLNGGEEKTMTLTNGRAIYRPEEDFKDGKVEATIRVTDGDEVKEFSWQFYIGEALTKHYRGQLHSHSNYSDGAGTPEEAIRYAEKAEYVDFFALTDHSNYFDDANKLGKIDDETSGLRAPDGSNRSKWQAYKAFFDGKATEDFLPLYGYEMTWTKSGANYGHMNTFNTEGFVSRNNSYYNDKTDSKGLLRYYELISNLGSDTFSQFNHPGKTFGNFDEFAHYDPKVNENIKLVEIGNGEGPIHGNGYFPSYDEYIKALDMGWKLAPSINQDNHKGRWGDANDGRNVVIADGLNKKDIITAIRNLSVYASEDKDITVDFTINGHIMGSTLADAGKTLNVDIAVAEQGGESIGAVDILTTGGKVIKSMESSADTDRFTFELQNDYPYYLVRITEADGDCVFTAPIWTKKVEAKGITALSPVGGDEATVGEEKELSYTFSAEGEKIQSVEVYDGDTLISTKTDDGKVTVVPKKEGKRQLTLKIKTDGGEYERNVELVVYPKGLATSPISEVQKAKPGEIFQIEGVLTSNASGYDKATAFFDAAYVQDETGGINIFPISGNYKIGDRLKIRGIRDGYQGERQLSITSMEKIGETTPPKPTVLPTGKVKDNTGLLIQTKGKVVSVNDDLSEVMIGDGSGKIKVFIDGYIGRPNSEDKSMPKIAVGDTLQATGLASVNPEGDRIRIRNRNDVIVVEDENDETKPTTPDKKPKDEQPTEKDGGIILTPVTPSPGKTDEGKPEAPIYNERKAFKDVKASDWFAKDVDRIVEKKLLVGMTEDTFGPNEKASRAMIVTMLHRMAGKPYVESKHKFTDIEKGSWYEEAVNWAEAKGITAGISETAFDPHGDITREAFVAMVYRYYVSEGLTETVEAKPLDGVSPWAQEAMTWAVNNKIVVGRENGDLAAKETITRAEIAAITLRVMDRFGSK